MNKKRIAFWLLSVVLIFSIWAFVAYVMKTPFILPDPLTVIKITGNLLVSKSFWINFIISFLRIFCGFFISAILGILTGFVCGCYKSLEYFFEIPLTVLRTIPVIAFILFVVYWFNSNVVPVFVCVMMSFPIMTSAVISGFGSVDSKLLEMADNFKFSKKQTFRYLKLPAVVPFIKNGMIQTFGLCWKVTIAGEVLCLPKKGLGAALQFNQIHLETGTVMAITLLLVVFCFTFEKLFAFCVKKLWREGK